MVRPLHLSGATPGTFYDPTKAEVWEYSERAGRYFWSKWSGNVDGKTVRLPQYNWMSPEFQAEAEKITRFWMDTGIDGMAHDAVNWYVGYTWEKGRQRITDVIASYGNTWRLPEGGGGFYEDPVAWVTEGNWNAMIDYGLGIWWENKNAIADAINASDPRPLEKALRGFHDRVVAAGGVLSAIGGRMNFSQEPQKQRLAVAILGTIGEFFSAGGGRGGGPQQPDDETQWLVKTKTAHPALHNLSTRRQLRTGADDKHYAFLRTARDGSERVLVVMNFQASPQTVEVDLSGIAAASLVELRSGEMLTRQNPLRVELPAYGYRMYQVKL
jgi:glycosidase